MDNYDPKSLGAKCGTCPLARAGSPVNPVRPVIPSNPLGVLVGDAPREEDAKAARPFSGATGEALAGSLAKAGVRLSTLLQINAVACTPETKKQWTHLGGAVEACRPTFLFHVTPYKHLHALLMGKWATQAWCGKAKAVDTSRGFVRDMPLKENTDDTRGSEDVSGQAAQCVDGSSEGIDGGVDEFAGED